MDHETKINTSHRVALISGIFCGLVALLLIFNFWHMKQSEPLESKTMDALLERLSQEPNNEVLQKEIRSFDLLARKAYFTSRWQVKTGTYLLLVSGIVLAVSLKIHTDLRARIEKPGEVTEALLRARANAQYWLFMTGGLVLGLALLAAYLNNDYLKEYQAGEPVSEVAGGEGNVEMINVIQGNRPAGSDSAGLAAGPAAGSGTTPGATPGEGSGAGSPEGAGTSGIPDAGEQQGAPSGTSNVPRTAGTAVFGPADFKANHTGFRGYMGQGISYHQHIPVHWDGSSGENIRWKVAFSKPGFSSPVIWGDRIFITGGDAEARVVSCYNRLTGQLIWEREVTGIPGSPSVMPKVSDDTGLAAPTMSVDGRRVYAIFATGDVVAFDLDGNLVWGRNLGVPNNHYGHSSSPQVWGKKLVIQYDTNTKGRMLALNTSNGETLWDITRPVHISWSSPALIERDGKIQIVTSADPYVAGYDLETGQELWKVEGMMGEVAPSVAYGDGLVFATNEYARLLAVKPEPGASYQWEDDEYLAEVASPVVYQDLLYVATSYGVLVCYDAPTGEKVWEKEFNDGFYSSPMAVEGKIYALDMGGTMHIIKADRSGSVISEPTLGEEGFTLPAFVDGAIYIRGVSHLFCISEQ